MIGAPLISSDGLLPEQGHVSTFNCCCIDGCSGTDQLDWLFVQIIWQSIQMLYFLCICAQKCFANKSRSRYSLFPADFSSTTSWIWIIAANCGDLHSIWHDIMISFDAKLLDLLYLIFFNINISRLIFSGFSIEISQMYHMTATQCLSDGDWYVRSSTSFARGTGMKAVVLFTVKVYGMFWGFSASSCRWPLGEGSLETKGWPVRGCLARFVS